VKYGNRISETLSVGVGVVSFGDPDWDRLWAASTTEAKRSICLKLDGVTELAEVRPDAAFAERAQAARFIHAVRLAVADAPGPEGLVFVPGAEVGEQRPDGGDADGPARRGPGPSGQRPEPRVAPPAGLPRPAEGVGRAAAGRSGEEDVPDAAAG